MQLLLCLLLATATLPVFAQAQSRCLLPTEMPEELSIYAHRLNTSVLSPQPSDTEYHLRSLSDSTTLSVTITSSPEVGEPQKKNREISVSDSTERVLYQRARSVLCDAEWEAEAEFVFYPRFRAEMEIGVAGQSVRLSLRAEEPMPEFLELISELEAVAKRNREVVNASE